MQITDYDTSYAANTADELEKVLKVRRSGDRNCFWLAPADSDYPQLGVFVNGDVAYLYYIPEEHNAGYQSLNKSDKPDGSTSFSMGKSSGDDIDVSSDAVVPFSTALAVAKEFLVSSELPKCVDWKHLQGRE